MTLSLKDLSKRDLVSILEAIEFARLSHTPCHVKDLILKVKDILEADFAVCGLANIPLEKPSDIVTVINGNYPAEWLDSYIKEGFYRLDPLIHYHIRFSPARLWSDIFKEHATAEVRSFLGKAWDFGLRYGLSSGLHLPQGPRFSVLCFGGKNNAFGERHSMILDTLSIHINKALLKASASTALIAQTKATQPLSLL